MLTLVAHDRRSGLQVAQPSEPVAAEQARNRSTGEAAPACDLEAGQAQTAQSQHHGNLREGRLFGAGVRARRAIPQPGGTFGAEARDPFAQRALGEASLGRDDPGREMLLEHALDNSRSTTWGQSGIMMDVHVEEGAVDEDAQP